MADAMPQEIERRFLVNGFVPGVLRAGDFIIQGYLPSRDGCTARVRIVRGKAFLTKKGRKSGCCRDEVEREIGLDVGLRLLRDRRVGDLIEKTRYRVDHGGFGWEVDVFHGANAGLIIAEIELAHPNELFLLPPWIGAEVTSRPEFSNSALARRPLVAMRSAA